MIEYQISKNARILFVGINPHPGSARRSVPFSNNKMFWYLLSRAGLIDERVEELRNEEVLSKMYHEKFASVYRLNFLNLVDRPTVNVTMLEKGEERAGVERVLKTVREMKPGVVCFVGKIVLQTFRGKGDYEWGWQPDVEGVPAYLMHFPHRGPAEVRIKELREIVEGKKRSADNS